MQQFKLHKNFILRRQAYQKTGIDECEYSPIVYQRLEKIELFERLRVEKCSLGTTIAALGIPQSTIYRLRALYKRHGLAGLEKQSTRPNNARKPAWKEHAVNKILHLRRQNPIYGKAKITVLLKRDHDIRLSVSTVGRILTDLIKRNKVRSASFYYAKKRIRPRVFNNHAQRWKHGMKAGKPGELLQIDHMTINLSSGFTVKHFQAICPITKIVFEQAYSCATSHIAEQFLIDACAYFPFPVTSIQVDGGSEFMSDFEQLCKDKSIPLFVLPPKTPENNGVVERANSSAKYEFYAFYSGNHSFYHLRKHLKRYVHKYNSYRPHQALQYLTPLQYYASMSEA